MQALALKYRPKNFDELIGQDQVSKSLTHALSEGRISHAYLFSGLRGSGKTSSARIFSKALVCEQGPTARPCERCAHCLMANESRHMDIIEMDAASHRKIDDIRELIEQTRYAPSSARFKIFIIDEVHMLTKEAFNALLKTLEEPPSYVKFILATTDPLKLPATVLSRTQHFRFKQISRLSVIKHLEFIMSKEGLTYEKEALEILARSGSGSLRDTLTLLDQAIIYSSANVTQTSVASMLGILDPTRIENILDVIMNSDRNRLKELISELETYEAEMIIDELIANLKEKFLGSDPRFSLLIFERFFRILAQAKGMLNTTSDNGFVLSIMLFMMMEALNLKSIDEAIAQATRPQENTPQVAKQTQNLNEVRQNLETKTPYQIFLEKIYDRDYELGKCFERNIKFLSFENSILTLASSASGNDQLLLRNSSKIIMQILKATLGANTTIKIEQQQELPTQNLALPKDDRFALLDDELSRLQKQENTTNNTPQIHKPKQESQSISSSLLSINANKSKEEMNKLRQDAVIMEAKSLFGEPRIEKVDKV